MDFKEFLFENNKQYTIVYHVSPRSDMKKLRPVSSQKGTRAFIGKGEPGIFVAPRFKDAVAWATTYVGGKKYHTQKPNERVKEKGGGWHGEKFKGIYKTLTIYEIQVPKEVLKNSVYTGWWEPEYFISAEDIWQMTIVGSKTYSFFELAKIKSKIDRTSFSPTIDKRIKSIAKTNLAAKYYLELKDLYNNALLQGTSPVLVSDDSPFSSNHLINKEIEKLIKYIFIFDGNLSVPINKLDKIQEIEVGKLYQRIKNMINNLN